MSKSPSLNPTPFYGRFVTVEAGSVFTWLRQGGLLFRVAPVLWIMISLLAIAFNLALWLVPYLGLAVSALLCPLILAGLYQGCQRISAGGMLRLSDLVAAINLPAFHELVRLGVLFMFVVWLGWSMADLLGHLVQGSRSALGNWLLVMFFRVIFGIPFLMGLVFSPMLVSAHGLRPDRALMVSFMACATNPLAFFILGLMILVLSFFCIISVGLGFVILFPVLVGTAYAAYLEIFPEA